MTERIPVTIWGATGFAGAELLRIFARHPHFEVVGRYPAQRPVFRSARRTPTCAMYTTILPLFHRRKQIHYPPPRLFLRCPTAPRHRRRCAASRRESA